MFANNTAPCNDGTLCTKLDACKGGKCVSGPKINCDDGNPCTVDTCDPVKRCQNRKNNKLLCDDGDACTTGDKCKDAVCLAGTATSCDDANPCTDDSCDAKKGCQHSANAAPCTDGSLCTKDDACKDGKCAGGKTINCDDGNPCTDDVCDPKARCQNKPNSAKCDDGSNCTTDDICKGGICGAKTPAKCDDNNPCTTEKCDSKGGCVNENNTVACDDGNRCTVGDKCKEGSCRAGATQGCDDGNPCTEDKCQPATKTEKGGCKNTVSTGACSDGNVCTTGDKCAGGKCTSGAPKSCDDGDACTDDSCDPKNGCQYSANAGPCNDGDACTENDKCKDGKCLAGGPAKCDDGNACTQDACDPTAGCIGKPVAGNCEDGNPCTEGDTCAKGTCSPGTAKVCDDGNACTNDLCDANAKGGCVSKPNTNACDDGDVCTTTDTCSAGACKGGTKLPCNDANPCTTDACDAKDGCQFTNNTEPCDDGSNCTTGESCKQGACTAAKPASCDDNNPCTTETCDAKGGCKNVNNTNACTDGSVCTGADACKDGKCVPGTAQKCDDGNPCTDDSCDPNRGCKAVGNTAKCDDGNVCTSNDACGDGSCKPGTPKVCDDGDVCTADFCDAKKGCATKPAAGGCDDGDACSTRDTCEGGKCTPGKKLVCNDGNPCTDDSCDAKTGCVFKNNTAPCSDGNACTDKDACKAGACAPGAALSCDDNNPCTTDSCDATKGCQAVANDLPCDDGSICTLGDACKAGNCTAGKTQQCDDGNPCTTDACDPKKGCTRTPNTAPCSDNNNCTEGDACKDGVCTPAKPSTCDDKNPCTTESCDAKGGCSKVNNTEPCSDGSVCTVADICSGGKCTPGKPQVCNDGNPCTADTCDKDKGCQRKAAPGKCDDGNVCTENDACAGGNCKPGKAQNCDDGNPCTADACDSKKGCVTKGISGDCTDGNPCTSKDACSNGKCAGTTPTVCDDGNPCTTDSCDIGKGCVNAASTGSCSDGNVCTENDVCSNGKCLPGKARNCNDNNPCTTDLCDPTTGCKTKTNTQACDDGNRCTTKDTCKSGKCVGTKNTSCDDGNPCTDDACDKGSGCVFTNNTKPCNDQNNCTEQDTCKAGVCTPKKPSDCDDKNPCTTESCDAKGGCSKVNNTAPCSDGSVCTVADICKAGKCTAGAAQSCDDGNPCTDDACDAKKGCRNTNNTKACDDGNVCSDKDACELGKCKPGALKNCDDKNPCTVDACNPAKGCQNTQTSDKCDDGNACTTQDACKAGKCVGGGKLTCDDGNGCTDDSCDATKGCVTKANTDPCNDGNVCTGTGKCGSGKCQPGAAKSCDDNNVCTTDSCDPVKGCKVTNNTLFCSDNNACTTGDICKDAKCTGPKAVSCDDGNPCTDDGCDRIKGCFHNNNKAACNDNNNCTTGDICKDGACTPTKPSKCDDGNICTTESCDPGQGCKSTNNTAPCSDGSVCTQADTCSGGKCVAGASQKCDDGNACTDNKCDAKAGCVTLPNTASCTDNNVCTKGDKCATGKCTSGVLIECDDNNTCTTDACDVTKGCLYTNNTFICTDGDVCTTGDKCKDGKCGTSGKLNCVDGNPCTDDSCDKATGCAFTANTAKCDDGNKCTTGDSCKGGKCVAAGASNCDDKKDCTTDFCDPSKGCANVNRTGLCSDGNACTENDTCKSGSCTAGTPKVCTDANPCTDNSCDKSKGCVVVNNTKSCNDGNSCTAGDTCSNGKCVGKPTVNCDDKNPCTDDSCSGNLGCVYKANTKACSDGDACTEGDKCANRVCKPAKLKNCDDGEPCTKDSCDKVKGCQKVNLTGACNDNNTCTTGETCSGGKCQGGKPLDCDDKNVCTDDSCDKTKGCVTKANTKACTDNNVCTEGDKCANSSCASGTPKKCDDSNPCTIDSCDKAKGCQTAPAKDGIKCGGSGVCAKGVCDCPVETYLTGGTCAACGCSPVGTKPDAGSKPSLSAILAPKNHNANDNYGWDVGRSGNRIIVGSRYDDTKGSNAGAASIFDKQADGTWKEVGVLYGDKASAHDQAGTAVAIDGDTAVVSAIYDDTKASDGGIVYVFVRQKDGTWKQTAALTGSDISRNQHFGHSVAIAGDWLFVGCRLDDINNSFDQGSVFVYHRGKDGKWSEKPKVLAPDGAAHDYFGWDVAARGKRLIVGAYGDDDKGSNSGSAYIWEFDGTAWRFGGKLIASDDASSDYFGSAVDIDRDRAIVGARLEDDSGSNAGAAYIFGKQANGAWKQVVRLKHKSPASGDEFGSGVAIYGDNAMVGARFDDPKGSNSGSVHVYARSGTGVWTNSSVIEVPTTKQNAHLGHVLALTAHGEATGGYNWDNKGAAFPISLATNDCSAKGVCACKPGYGGDKCDKLVDPCQVAGFCNDGNPCTVDSCDKTKKACVHTAAKDGTACDDGSQCTGVDACKSGKCVSAKPAGCDDGNHCTRDTCVITVGCTNTKLSDGTTCGGVGTCKSNTCVCPSHTYSTPARCENCACDANGGKVTAVGAASHGPILAKPSKAYDQVGWSVGADGSIAAAGVPRLDAPGVVDCGGVAIYERKSGTWTGITKLLPMTPRRYDNYGFYGTAVSGNWVISGGPYADAKGSNTGGIMVWQRQKDGSYKGVQELSTNDPNNGDEFGWAVDIEGDWLVGGARLDDQKSGNASAVYVFKHVAGKWTQNAKLMASNGGSSDYLGMAVSISGEYVIGGAPREDTKSSNAGAAYIWQRQNDGSWKETAKLVGSNSNSSDYFGHAVAISGPIAIVGAYRNDDKASTSGSAYAFERQSNGKWTQTAILRSNDIGSGDYFGHSVALQGTYAVVGARYEDHGFSNSGSVHAFQRQQDKSWKHIGKASGAESSDELGVSVALTKELVAFGGAWRHRTDEGAIYPVDLQIRGCTAKGVCTCNPGYAGDKCDKVVDPCLIEDYCDDGNACTADSCDKTAKKCVNKAVTNGTKCDDGSVCTLSDTCQSGTCKAGSVKKCNDGESCTTDSCDAVLGCRFKNVNDGTTCAGTGACGNGQCACGPGEEVVNGKCTACGCGIGAVKAVSAPWISGSWYGVTKLPYTRYGWSLDRDGKWLLVGAAYSDGVVQDGGAAHLHEMQANGSWSLKATLVPKDVAAGDHFGWSVAVDGGIVAVSSRNDDDKQSNSGSVYIFEADKSGKWTQTHKLIAPDVGRNDHFGSSIALDKGRLVVGAPYNDDRGSNSGSVYVFERQKDGKWKHIVEFTPSVLKSGDEFGWDVAVSGDRIAVGARYDDGAGSNAGTAYVFERQTNGSYKEIEVSGVGLVAHDHFGYAIAIDGDDLVVAAPWADRNGAANVGEVGVYRRDKAGKWTLKTRLLPSGACNHANFGYDVAVHSGAMLVGDIINSDAASRSGGAAFYRYNADSWQLMRTLTTTKSPANSQLGRAVTLDASGGAISTYVTYSDTGMVATVEFLAGTCDSKGQCTCQKGYSGAKCDVFSGCKADADCNDGNSCTTDTCNKSTGKCTNAVKNNGVFCTDGNACTLQDRCSSGVCKPGKARVCNDGKACTTDSCNPISGCVATPIADGSACESGTGTCGTGSCICSATQYSVSGACKDCGCNAAGSKASGGGLTLGGKLATAGLDNGDNFGSSVICSTNDKK